MRYLVDTHILLWSFFELKKLSDNAESILRNEDNDIFYSPISLWEISIKYGLNRLSLGGMTPEEFFAELHGSYFIPKEISGFSLMTNYKLSLYHRDPFDRFLIWEAIQSGMTLLSCDEKFAEYRNEGLSLTH